MPRSFPRALRVLSPASVRRRKLNLALQGGGAHGAFTWGVLDRLLDPLECEIASVSGTSAGAINAVAMAAGYLEDGAEGARRKLAAVWSAIGDSGTVASLLSNGPPGSAAPAGGDDSPFYRTLRLLTETFSPYELNPYEIDPLRQVLETHIDFAQLRRNSAVALFINATEVATGRGRIFTSEDLTLDAVLASACLPSLRHAVKIGRHYYWDGVFSANPPLLPLIENGGATDTLIVRLVPAAAKDLPKTSVDIQHNISRLIMSQSLRNEILVIEAARRMARENIGVPGKFGLRLRRHRFHAIEAERYLAKLGPASAVIPDRDILAYLHDSGRKAAANWWGRNKDAIGRRSTINVASKIL